MLYVFINVDPKNGFAHGSPLSCLPFQPFLFLLLEICIFIFFVCVFYLKEGKFGEDFCVYICVGVCAK